MFGSPTSPKRQRVNTLRLIHSLALFEVALFDNRGDQQGETQGIITTRRVTAC
jgi:hypothetical protein